MRIPLQPEIVRAALVTSGGRWWDIEFHPSIGSTNERARSYAAELASGESPLWHVVLTDHQTGGRGRLGRTWEVPDLAAIALSAIVPVADPATAGWFPLLAGLALSRTIAEVTAAAGSPVTAWLKWPNDVLLAEDQDRKVSGILCELVTLAAGGHAVVVGTGINVDQSRDELPVDTATSLALALGGPGGDAPRIPREDLVIAYLTHLAELVDPAGDGTGRIDIAGGRAAYGMACSTIGSEVRIHLPTGEIAQGQASGVDRFGGLVVATAHGVRTFAAGDVVHVRNALGGLA